MREILFRGKAIDDNWYYGVPLVFTEDYVCMTAPHTYNKAVIPETVGQYTGLTDKNGKKIFEGDIVKWNINFAIVWQDCKFVIKKDLISKAYDYVLSCFDGTEFEVIGNIHDNSELMKEKSNER